MLKFVSPLLVALLVVVVDGNAAETRAENTATKLIPGKKYHFESQNYPYSYSPGYTARWLLNSDGPIEFLCTTRLHNISNCSAGLLSIHDGDNRIPMCDSAIYNYTTATNQVSVTFFSLPNTRAGSFTCSFINHVQTPTAPPTPPPTNAPACTCGAKNYPTVSREPETGVNEFPMFATLIDSTQNEFLCGATIINKKQVLTTAQCVVGRNPANMRVLVGDHDTSTFSDTNATKLYLVDSIKIHQDYTMGSENFNIAMVTIKLNISFSQQVNPVCLPVQHYPDTFGGNFVNLVGWKTEPYNDWNILASTTMKTVKVVVSTNMACGLVHGDLTHSNLCTVRNCENFLPLTEGGPVLWQNPSTGRLVIVGIIGTKSGCFQESSFQVHTRVGAFINWIGENTAKGIGYCVPE